MQINQIYHHSESYYDSQYVAIATNISLTASPYKIAINNMVGSLANACIDNLFDKESAAICVVIKPSRRTNTSGEIGCDAIIDMQPDR